MRRRHGRWFSVSHVGSRDSRETVLRTNMYLLIVAGGSNILSPASFLENVRALSGDGGAQVGFSDE